MIMAIVVVSQPVCANEVSKQLESMSSSERANALAGFLQQSGRDCSNVFRIFLQGHDSEDVAYWNVTCSNGQSYNILVNANPEANTVIVDCINMKALAGIECFQRFTTAN
ncbi:MAG: hypothetical protein WBQ78_00495 [Gammaproteobacteria bacterium]